MMERIVIGDADTRNWKWGIEDSRIMSINELWWIAGIVQREITIYLPDGNEPDLFFIGSLRFPISDSP